MRIIKLQTVETVTKLSEQHIQNKTRMENLKKIKRDCNKGF